MTSPQTSRQAAPRPGGWAARWAPSRARLLAGLATHRPALLLSLATTAIYCLVAVTQWRAFVSPSWDLGIFTQLAQAYSRFEAPIVPIRGHELNLLGDHFHPILVLLGPVYAIFPSGLTLLVVQAVLVGISVFPLTSVAIERLGTRRGVVAGAAYAFSFGIQGAVATQFHEIAFALPMLAFGLAAFLRRRPLPAALWLGALVFVKEDLGLTVMILGGLLATRAGDDGESHPERARRIGVALALWGVSWFVLTTTVILPALNPQGTWEYTDRLGAVDLLGDPLGTLAAFFTPGEKVVTLLLLVAAAGVVGMRSPLMLALLPTLAWRFLGEVHFYWGWTWHYNAVLMPIVAAALLDGLARAERRRPVTTESGPREEDAPSSRRQTWLTRGALAAAVMAVVLPARDLPVLGLLSADTYRTYPRHETARDVLDLVPPGVTVASDIGLLAHLVPDRTALWTGTPENPVPDYIVLDDQVWGESAPEDAVEYASSRYEGTQWSLILEENGYRVLRLDEP